MTLNFLVLLPFIASAMYGLCYVFVEKVIGVHVSPATFLTLNACANLFAILFLVFVRGDALDFKDVVSSWPIFLMVFVAACAPVVGWVLTIYSIKHMSALFTALAETSYPLFTMAFGFMFFGIRQLNFITFCGGMMVLIGAIIMVYGKNQSLAQEP